MGPDLRQNGLLGEDVTRQNITETNLNVHRLYIKVWTEMKRKKKIQVVDDGAP